MRVNPEPQMPLSFISTIEKLARLEVKVESLMEQIEHIDICVDSLKRTIWQATGAMTILVTIAAWLLKHS